MNRPPRTVLLIAHTGRREAVEVACAVSKRLMDSDMSVRLLAEEARDLGIANADGRRRQMPMRLATAKSSW